MTEREWREQEELGTSSEIIEEILQIDAFYSELSITGADDEIARTIKALVRQLRKKELYKVKISRKYVKKQSLLSRLRDYKVEKAQKNLQGLKDRIEMLQQLKQFQELQAQADRLKLEYTANSKPKGLISRLKAWIANRKKPKAIAAEQPGGTSAEQTSSASEDNSLSGAPPTAEEQPQPEVEVVQEQAKECEVVVDYESKDDTISDDEASVDDEASDDVLDF